MSNGEAESESAELGRFRKAWRAANAAERAVRDAEKTQQDAWEAGLAKLPPAVGDRVHAADAGEAAALKAMDTAGVGAQLAGTVPRDDPSFQAAFDAWCKAGDASIDAHRDAYRQMSDADKQRIKDADEAWWVAVKTRQAAEKEYKDALAELEEKERHK